MDRSHYGSSVCGPPGVNTEQLPFSPGLNSGLPHWGQDFFLSEPPGKFPMSGGVTSHHYVHAEYRRGTELVGNGAIEWPANGNFLFGLLKTTTSSTKKKKINNFMKELAQREASRK